LAYTAHGPVNAACNVYIVPSDRSIGDQPKQFTWLPDTSDYDPSWSPLNTEIAFGRADFRIVRKGIPGLSADTTEILVAASGSYDDHGDITPAISPNGQWVAFSRKDQVTFDYHIWKAPIGGGAATQLTFTPGLADQYPSWSHDGQWIAFDREIGFPAEYNSYKVKANQTQQQDTLTTAIYRSPAGTDGATPAFSPDNRGDAWNRFTRSLHSRHSCTHA
jgi:Tol biopolymer transport system component